MKKTILPPAWFAVFPTPLLIHMLQCVGIYTFPSRSSRFRVWIGTFWAVTVAAWCALFFVFDIITFYKNYSQTLRQKDFFLYTFVTYRGLFDIKAAACILLLHHHTPKLQAVVSRLADAGDLRRWVWTLVTFAVVGAGIVVGVLYYCFNNIATVSAALYAPHFRSWESVVDVPLFGPAPFITNLLVYEFGNVVTYLVDVLPLLLTAVVAVALTNEFRMVNRRIRGLLSERLHHSERDAEVSVAQELDRVQRRQLQLAEMTGRWDAGCRDVILLSFLTALMGGICLLTEMVRPVSSRVNDGPLDLVVAVRPTMIALVVQTGGVDVLLTVCAIRLNEAAYESAELVSALGPLLHDPIARLNAAEALSRFHSDPVTLTIGRFIPLTRDVFATIFALLLSYVIVIYQMVDGQNDMRNMLQKSQAMNMMTYVIQTVLCAAAVPHAALTVNLTTPACLI
ncbi:uncharacterized protein LOC129592642 [Paramacrobiotus metropolitanus]|uniref:uncharacterized protein LOC129592642 n=1 Tax=Paramacrobiotus metropolitanus TaxID=2943436 RepID=UPI002445AAE5|nr:uncharacterized protein LOC129592642 [Paramacrobiotus metropolitanus]